MGLRERFNDSLKEAMKAQEKRRVSTLRLILAALKDRDIAARTEDKRDGVSDDEVLQLLAKMIKQREESAATYEGAARLDLAQAEREEIEIIRRFMPRQLTPEEVREAATKVIGEIEAKNLKDMGRAMSALKERYAGQMDFARASAVVKELLAGA